MTAIFTLHEHGLDDAVLAKRDETVDDCLYIVSDIGLVNQTDIIGLNGIELADVVIHPTEGFKDSRTQNLSGIGEK